MKKGFYRKLAFTGIRKNKKFYTPYILTCIGMIMMFYIISFLGTSDVLLNMKGGDIMRSMMGLGYGVMAVFSLIFLFYTNSFLIRRRKKEFGLYNYHEKGVTNSNFETIKNYCKKSVSMTYPVLVKVVPKDPNPDIGMHIINYIGYDKSNSKAYMYDPKPVNGKGVYKTVSDNSQNYYSEGYKFNTRWSRIYYGDNH